MPVGPMRMRTAWLLAALLAAALPAHAAKPPKVQWLDTFPGLGEASGYWVRQTPEGGFIAAGVTGDDSPRVASRYFVVRLDSAGGRRWSNTYCRNAAGLEGGGVAYCVQPTLDLGSVVYGYDDSSTGSARANLLKLDSTGGALWRSTFYDYDDSFDSASAVQQTMEGGCILTGMFRSSGPYLLKTNASGARQWSWAVRESYRERWPEFVPVALTLDGGYMTTGHNDSFGLTLWKVNGTGAQAVRNYYPDEHMCDGQSVVKTIDGGFAIAGLSGRSKPDGGIYLLKVDMFGVKQWCRYFNNRDYYDCTSVWQTGSTGYVMAGTTNNRAGHNGDAFVLRTDMNGNELWYTTISPTGGSSASCVQQTYDGGYIVCGGMAWRVGSDRVHDCMFVAKLAPDRKH